MNVNNITQFVGSTPYSLFTADAQAVVLTKRSVGQAFSLTVCWEAVILQGSLRSYFCLLR